MSAHTIPSIDALRAMLPTTDGSVDMREYADRIVIDFHWRNRPHQTAFLIGQPNGITVTIMRNEGPQALIDDLFARAKQSMADAYAQSAPGAP